jgi:hypothetical protein
VSAAALLPGEIAVPVRVVTRSFMLLAVSGATLLAAGCSRSESPPPTSTSTTRSASPAPTSTSSTAPPPTSVVSPGASVPFDLADNARADVSPGPCTATSGGWVFHGTVKNPAPRPKRFQIVVDFVSHPGSTVLATTVLNFPSVAPHSTEAWSAVGAKGESGVSCVVRLAQSS